MLAVRSEILINKINHFSRWRILGIFCILLYFQLQIRALFFDFETHIFMRFLISLKFSIIINHKKKAGGGREKAFESSVRVQLAPSDIGLPFTLKRRQYPNRLAYSMTINKSQGQTFDRVGVYLKKPCFSH